MHVVPKDTQIANGHNILRNAVVFGRYPALSDQLCFHATENLLAGIVQLFKPAKKILFMGLQAVADNFICTRFQYVVLNCFAHTN